MCIYKYCDWLGWPVDPSWASNLIGGSVFWRLRQLMTVEAKSHGFPWIQFLLACRGHFCHPLHHPCYLWANAFVKIGQMVGDEPTQVLQHLGSHLHKSFVIWHPQRSWGLSDPHSNWFLADCYHRPNKGGFKCCVDSLHSSVLIFCICMCVYEKYSLV